MVSPAEVSERQQAEATRLGLYLLFVSIAIFFGALSVVLLIRGIGDVDWKGVPIPYMVWVSTAVILASSAMLHRGNRTIGIRLGWVFLVCQVLAWAQIFSQRGPGSWFFWTFSGLHALHILGGLGGFRWAKFESARAYWHFVTALWIYVMALFLVLRGR